MSFKLEPFSKPDILTYLKTKSATYKIIKLKKNVCTTYEKIAG